MVQTGLDIADLIPGLGEIADGINAGIYLLRGDYVNAALSAASMIPFAGMATTGAKLVNKAVHALKHVDEVAMAAKLVISKADDVYKFAKNVGKHGDDVAKLTSKVINKSDNVAKGLSKMDNISKAAKSADNTLEFAAKKMDNVAEGVTKQGDSIKGATKAPISQMTNDQLVQEIATRAENKIGGTGRVAGTQKHAYSQKLLDRYQRMFGDRGLRTETNG